MRLESRAKLGYYPLPPVEGDKLRSMLQFPSTHASAIDPCAGTAAAILQLTSGADVYHYGVELDTDRAKEAKANGVDVLHGNVFDTSAKSGQFSFLYLNPPYDSEVGSYGNQRMEYAAFQWNGTCRGWQRADAWTPGQTAEVWAARENREGSQ